MAGRRQLITGVAILAMGLGTLHAQTATTTRQAAGEAVITTNQITGEVLAVEGNTIVGKLQPSGEIRTFNIQPGQKFTIDGLPKLLQDLKPGTVLTATVITTTRPVTVRTTTVTNGTVVFVSGTSVILRLEDGQHRQYTVPDSYRFMVNGSPASVFELRKGMKVSGAKIVESPTSEISKNTIISGQAPK